MKMNNAMKIGIFLLCSFVLFSSCSSDTDGEKEDYPEGGFKISRPADWVKMDSATTGSIADSLIAARENLTQLYGFKNGDNFSLICVYQASKKFAQPSGGEGEKIEKIGELKWLCSQPVVNDKYTITTYVAAEGKKKYVVINAALNNSGGMLFIQQQYDVLKSFTLHKTFFQRLFTVKGMIIGGIVIAVGWIFAGVWIAIIGPILAIVKVFGLLLKALGLLGL